MKEDADCSQASSSFLQASSATWGHVTIRPDSGHEPLIYVNRPTVGATPSLYVWSPCDELQGEVLNNAVVILRCEVTQEGVRRFSPIGTGNRSLDPFQPFYSFAFACGLAIRIKAKHMTAEQRQTYRAMFFLFQRAQRMRQHIRRVFTLKKDLVVARSGRCSEDPSEEHILPWQFGSSTQSLGYPQSVATLMELGKESACKAGILNPTSAQRIHYGLAEVARLQPKHLESDTAQRVIKSALFDINTNREPLPPELWPIIEDRVMTTIWPHLDYQTEVFNDWFWGRHNTFIKQVAQQKKAPGGELDPEDVEQYLLQRGWDAYEYVGHCVHVWAYDMLKAMPEPLSESERHAFELLYFCRPEFGGIPLILLAEKLRFVDTVLRDIVDHPGEQKPIDVLYQLLQFYSTMLSNRREADVRIKNALSKAKKNLEKDSGQMLSLEIQPEVQDHSDDFNRVENSDMLEAVFQYVAKVKNLTCPCAEPNWKREKTEEIEETHEFRLTFRCTGCQSTKELVLSVKEQQDIESQFAESYQTD